MNNELQTVNSNVLSLEEAAKQFGVTYSTFRRFLIRHPKIQKKYINKQKHNGRMKRVINKEALLIIANIKDGFRGNKFSKMSVTDTLQNRKQEFMEAMTKDPVIALRMEQLAMKKDIEHLKEDVQKVKQIASTNYPEKLTEGQRARLNERVRAFVNAAYGGQSWEYAKLWNDLNKFMKRDSINDYTFEDYDKAISYLKARYKEYNLIW
jgi:hypothetical protein